MGGLKGNDGERGQAQRKGVTLLHIVMTRFSAGNIELSFADFDQLIQGVSAQLLVLEFFLKFAVSTLQFFELTVRGLYFLRMCW